MKSNKPVVIRVPKNARTHTILKQLAENRKLCAGPSYLKPGIYTDTISAHPDDIANKVSAFHARMARAYEGYTVIDTATYAMPVGVCFYVTYSIGAPRLR